jgi:phage shock protein E
VGAVALASYDQSGPCLEESLMCIARHTLVAVSVSLALLAGCSGGATESTATSQAQSGVVATTGKQVTVDVFTAAIQDTDVVILDVRTPAEFASGHLPGAINLNVQAATFLNQVENLDKTATYAIYCRSGDRSQIALDAMMDAGFESVFGLAGGMTEWTAADGDITLD